MELITPNVGLVFWLLIIFGIFYFLLGKFAWKPIMSGLKSREDSIENSLKEAGKARDEMAKLTADNEKLLVEARKERDEILRDARAISERMINEAKDKAGDESRRMLEKAREEINSEKMAAITEIKNQVGNLSILVAEKLLRKELSDSGAQKAYAEKVISEFHLN